MNLLALTDEAITKQVQFADYIWPLVVLVAIVGLIVVLLVKTPKFTGAQWLRFTGLLAAVPGAIMTIGDKITAVPGLPGWFVHYWPQVLSFAVVWQLILTTFFPHNATPSSTPANPQ